MLSALARAIHNDVRNNDNQELNLSSHPPAFPVQQRGFVDMTTSSTATYPAFGVWGAFIFQ
jgi:hypothetical protein